MELGTYVEYQYHTNNFDKLVTTSTLMRHKEFLKVVRCTFDDIWLNEIKEI